MVELISYYFWEIAPIAAGLALMYALKRLRLTKGKVNITTDCGESEGHEPTRLLMWDIPMTLEEVAIVNGVEQHRVIPTLILSGEEFTLWNGHLYKGRDSIADELRKRQENDEKIINGIGPSNRMGTIERCSDSDRRLIFGSGVCRF